MTFGCPVKQVTVSRFCFYLCREDGRNLGVWWLAAFRLNGSLTIHQLCNFSELRSHYFIKYLLNHETKTWAVPGEWMALTRKVVSPAVFTARVTRD